MKKLVTSLALASALFLFGSIQAAHAVIISTTIAEARQSLPLHLNPGESMSYSITGTVVGTLRFERSLDATNWAPIGISSTNNSNTIFTGSIYNSGPSALYRVNVSTWISGSFSVLMWDNDDIVTEIKNKKNVTAWSLSDERVFDRMVNYVPNSEASSISLSSATQFTRDVFKTSFNTITSTGAALILSARPTISTYSAVMGDLYIIQSTTATITFQDNGTLAGSGLELGSTTRALGVGDILMLIYRAGFWWEIGFFNN